MIKNERQYKITQSQVAKFEAALAELAVSGGKNARLRQLEREALQSQLHELQEEVHLYEQLQSGAIESIHIESLDELPIALVKARIAAGLSQKELADRLGLKEQQIQRYESTDYASASLTRLTQVAEALGISIAGEMTYAE